MKIIDWAANIRTAVSRKLEINVNEAERKLGTLAGKAARSKSLSANELGEVASLLELLKKHPDHFVECIRTVEEFDSLLPHVKDYEKREAALSAEITKLRKVFDDAHELKRVTWSTLVGLRGQLSNLTHNKVRIDLLRGQRPDLFSA